MKRRSLTLGFITAISLTLGACSDKPADLPSLADGAGAQGTQAERADAMFKCLTEAEVGVTIETAGNGEQRISFGDAVAFEYSLGGYGTSGGGGGVSATAASDAEALMAKNQELVAKYTGQSPQIELSSPGPDSSDSPGAGGLDGASPGPASGASPAPTEPATPPYLVMDGIDYSPDWSRCLTESGYTEPEFLVDPAVELAEKQRAFEGTLEWIKCARQNGYPDMADPLPAKVDRFATTPTAVLPVNTSEAELRALLAQCPAFDEEAFIAQMEAVEALGDHPDGDLLQETILANQPPRIEIGFDVPGWDGTTTPIDLPQSEWDRLSHLDDVIREAQMEAYAERSGQRDETGEQ
jgi:hypothetical protein